MERIGVLYDETCGFCCECARWLSRQEQLVPVVCIPRQAREVGEAFGELDRPGTRPELVVVDSDGGVYRDADAWVVTLWALKDFRGWAKRFARPGLKPFARSLFEFVSSNRQVVSRILALESDLRVQERLQLSYGDPWAPRCTSQGCG